MNDRQKWLLVEIDDLLSEIDSRQVFILSLENILDKAYSKCTNGSSIGSIRQSISDSICLLSSYEYEKIREILSQSSEKLELLRKQ